MYKTINFVQRAINKGDHFTIENSRIFACDGVLTMSAPIDMPIDCKPKADTFIAAIKSANDSKSVPSFSITPTGRLSIKAGKLRALIECKVATTEEFRPEGIDYTIDGEDFLKTITLLEPFMGTSTDPGKSWANGILFTGNKAYVTCNTVAIEYESNLNIALPIVIPAVAIKEIIKLKMKPLSVRYCARSITLFYDNGMWLKTRTIENKFPNFGGVLYVPCNPVVLPDDFFNGLRQLKPFCDEEFSSITFTDTGLVTKNEANYEISIPVNYGIYNYNLLILLESIVDKIDFSTYPKPAIFTGERLRGCVVGYAR